MAFAVNQIRKPHDRVVWAAATLIWEIGLKSQELSSSDFILKQLDYVHLHLNPVAIEHPSPRVRVSNPAILGIHELLHYQIRLLSH